MFNGSLLALRVATLLTAAAALYAPSASQASQSKHPGPPCVPLAEVTPGSNGSQSGLSQSDPAQTDPVQTEPAQTDPVQADPTFKDRSANPVTVGHEVCIEAHVYDVVEITDGRRFLDVCPTETPDDQCRFVLLSLPGDRDDVGDLRRYRNQEIKLRGMLRPIHGRVGILISHARQFNGGPEKFRPNPRLLRDFNAQSDRMPVRDPNLSPAGHHRSFMNTRDKETLPPAKR